MSPFRPAENTPSFLVGLVSLTLGCATARAPFANRAVLWSDPDRGVFEGRPAELYTPPRWDAVDHTVFRPLAELWTFERGREAINVNALDEVPSSSWFENRAARLTPELVERGACGETPAPAPPWRVIRRKTTGTRPGFLMQTDGGARYFVRTDETLLERGTAADAVGTRLFWAAGYDTPCNQVAFVRPEDLVLAGNPSDPEAPTQADIDLVVERATRAPDGRLRLSVSRFVDGAPIGGWQFWGARGDDPNDVVPHQHRRDVRGMVVLAAWMNRIDSRSENNLDAWVEVAPGRGYVRHYVLDTSDAFGIVWSHSALIGQRFGQSYYLDLQQMLEDLLTLGVLERPYYVPDERRGLAAHLFGYYDVERFDPERWRNGYPNPAFERATERDRAWMARILARIDPAMIEAAVRAGQLSRPLYAAELARILRGRRERILERYLSRLSPLGEPALNDDRLCLDDLAVVGGVRRIEDRAYEARAWRGWPAVAHATLGVEAQERGLCVTLPSDPATSETRPTYWVLDLTAMTGTEQTGPARVHLYQLGDARYRVVGLERPPRDAPPP